MYAFIDDADPSLSFSPASAWTHQANATGGNGVERWTQGTYSMCGGTDWNSTVSDAGRNETQQAGGCEVRVPFSGTFAELLGTNVHAYIAAQYYCRLEYTTDWGETVTEGAWAWFDGSQRTNSRDGMNVTLCSVTSIPAGNHTLVLGVEPDQVAKGLAIDLYQWSNDVMEGASVTWRSDFSSSVPPDSLRYTTETSAVPTATSSTSSPSSSASPSSPSHLGLGLGLGLGLVLGGTLLAALGYLAFYCARQRRDKRRKGAVRMSLPISEGDSWSPGTIIPFEGGATSPVEREGGTKEWVQLTDHAAVEDPGYAARPPASTLDTTAAHPGSCFSASSSANPSFFSSPTRRRPSLPTQVPASPLDSTAGHAGSFMSHSPAGTLPHLSSFFAAHQPQLPVQQLYSQPQQTTLPPQRELEDLPIDAPLEDPSAFRARL